MSGAAIGAIICGVLSLAIPVLGFLVGVAAIVLGVVALRRLRDDERPQRGIGLAIAGICVGGLGAVMTVFWVITGLAMIQSFRQIETMVANIELAEHYEVIYELDFFSDFEIIEKLNGLETL